MSNEEFYNWWKKGGIESPTIHETGAAWKAWQARQPEIDALIHDNGNMRKAIAEYDKENAALKAEVEQLRNDNQRLQDAINITWQCSPKFDKTFCSQCGGEFGPGDHGYSHCESHEGQRRIR